MQTPSCIADDGVCHVRASVSSWACFISVPAFSQGLPACPPLQVSGVLVRCLGTVLPCDLGQSLGLAAGSSEERGRLHGTSFIEFAQSAPTGLHYVVEAGFIASASSKHYCREYLQIQVVIWAGA